MPGSHQRGRARRTPRHPPVAVNLAHGEPTTLGPSAGHGRCPLPPRAAGCHRSGTPGQSGHPDTVKDCRSEATAISCAATLRASWSHSGWRLRGGRDFRACVIKPPLSGGRSEPDRGGEGESITPGLACYSPLTGLTDTVDSPSRIVKSFLPSIATRQLDTISLTLIV